MEFHHIALSVRNLEKSSSFYKDNFGFKEIKKYTKKGWDGEAAILRLKNMELELFHFNGYIKNKDDASKLNILGVKHIAFKVGNAEKRYKELKSKGINISKPKIGITCSKFCFLKDPDGISIELYEK